MPGFGASGVVPGIRGPDRAALYVRRVIGSSRRCARPDCSGDAVASLGYDYRARTVWLDPCLDPDPSRHDLCQRHADRLRVPAGWRLHDRRAALPDALALPAPAAH